MDRGPAPRIVSSRGEHAGLAALEDLLEHRKLLQARLALYQQGQPYRQPPVRTALAPASRAQANR